MTLKERVRQQANMLRICASQDGCSRCPLDDYIGSCTEKLKRDSAEIMEDQQAIIQALSRNVANMTASIVKLRDKYSGCVYGPKEERS